MMRVLRTEGVDNQAWNLPGRQTEGVDTPPIGRQTEGGGRAADKQCMMATTFTPAPGHGHEHELHGEGKDKNENKIVDKTEYN